MAKFSGGEYQSYDVFKAIWFGGSFLYIGYMCDSKSDSEFAALSVDNANLIVAKYVTMKREKDFVGYTVVRLDDSGAHVWQASVTKEYRGTNLFEMCVEFIVQQMAAIGVKRVSFTSMRQGWGEKIESIGFKEGPTTFHREIVPVPVEGNTDHIQV
jgi:GNAT superfamily N-acetyltransferase